MGLISVRLNSRNKLALCWNTDLFKMGNNLPVLNKTLTVDVVEKRHRFSEFRTLSNLTETASVRVKNCATKTFLEDFLSRRDGKALLDREVLKMSSILNSMPAIVFNDDSFLALPYSMHRHAIILDFEYSATVLQARVTDEV